MDKTDKIFQYQCLRDVLERLNNGAAYVAIHTPGGDEWLLSELMDPDAITKRIRGDVMMTLRTVRQELITELINEHNAEIGVDTDSDWAIEPFPIGTPKSDHRRCGDSDDGK